MVELAKPKSCGCGYEYGEHYTLSDIAAERERWLKAVADADKSGYARAKTKLAALCKRQCYCKDGEGSLFSEDLLGQQYCAFCWIARQMEKQTDTYGWGFPKKRDKRPKKKVSKDV